MSRVHKKLLMRDVWGDPSNNGTDSSTSCIQCIYKCKAHPSVSGQTNEFKKLLNAGVIKTFLNNCLKILEVYTRQHNGPQSKYTTKRLMFHYIRDI